MRRDAVGNVAQPHLRRMTAIVPCAVDAEIVPAIASAAAGGVRCSLNDMLTWMRMWLPDSGQDAVADAARGAKSCGRRIRRCRCRSGRTALERTNFSAYGYGWRLSDVDGVLRVAHTGTLSGMYSAVTLLPGKRDRFRLPDQRRGARCARGAERRRW